MFTEQPPTFEKDGVKLWELGEGPDSSVAYVEVAPGATIKPHFHSFTEETYIFTQGSGRMCLREPRDKLQTLAVTKGDSVSIPVYAVHELMTRNGISFYVVTSPPYDPGDHSPADL